MTMETQRGLMGHKPGALGPPELDEAGQILPPGPSERAGPSEAVIWDVRPPQYGRTDVHCSKLSYTRSFVQRPQEAHASGNLSHGMAFLATSDPVPIPQTFPGTESTG